MSSVSPNNTQRSILRRSMSGSSIMGKRVTIQDPVNYFDSHNQTTFDPPTRVGSPGPISPVSSLNEMSLQLDALNLSTDLRNRHTDSTRTKRGPPPEQTVLQQMAAAQM
jgi:hypothetical protein